MTMKWLFLVPRTLLWFAPSLYALEDNGLCPLLAFLPFSDQRNNYQGFYYPSRWSEESFGKAAFSKMVAVQMAVNHFNERNPVLVPQLSLPVYQDCNVTVPSVQYADTRYDFSAPIQQYVDALLHEEHKPCAILSPVVFRGVLSITSVAQTYGSPVMVYDTPHNLVTGKNPVSFQTALRTGVVGEHFVSYVLDHLERDYVAVVTGRAEDAATIKQGIRDALSTTTAHYLAFEAGGGINLSQKSIAARFRVTLKDIQTSGYKTIFWYDPWDLPGLEVLAQEADALGMLDGSYLWILHSVHVPHDYLDRLVVSRDSAFYRLLQGSAAFGILDGFGWQQEDDAFWSSWKSQDASLVNQLNSVHPLRNETNVPEYYVAEESFFQTEEPVEGSSLIYDAIMAACMGACQAGQENDNDLGNGDRPPPPPSDGSGRPPPPNGQGPPPGQGPPQRRQLQANPGFPPPPPGGYSTSSWSPHVAGVNRVEFDGASGRFQFDRSNSKIRVKDTVTVGIYNLRARPTEKGDNGDMVQFEKILASHTVNGTWQDVDDFVYASGTTLQPEPLLAISDFNYISPSVQAIGLSLMGLCILLCAGSSLYIALHRKHNNFKSAQPFFLHLLCLGSAISSCAILFLSFDEGNGFSSDLLSTFCMAAPWFFFSGGVVVYAAVFSKLWRLQRVMQMRRQRITIVKVIGPLLLLFLCTIVVLSLWTILEPFHWERELVSDNPPESFGKCSSEHFDAFFGTLVGLLMSAAVLAGIMAWRTRDINEYLSESKWLFYAIFTHVQTWIVGLPVLVVLENESVDASYIVKALLVWTFSMSTLLLLIGPKIVASVRSKLFKNDSTTGTRANIRISGLPPPEQSRSTSFEGHQASSWGQQPSAEDASLSFRGTNPTSPSSTRTSVLAASAPVLEPAVVVEEKMETDAEEGVTTNVPLESNAGGTKHSQEITGLTVAPHNIEETSNQDNGNGSAVGENAAGESKTDQVATKESNEVCGMSTDFQDEEALAL